jgi:transcriptional regulator with XRE-family HTH domain
MDIASPTVAESLAHMGQRLSRARTMKRLTQDELASDCGVSRRAIQRMEDGQNVSVSTWFAAAARLGYQSDLMGVLEQDKPLRMAEFQMLATGKIDQRKRVRK